MENNVRVADVALQLEQEKIFAGHPDPLQLYGHLFAALRTAHLLTDTLENTVEGMRVPIHCFIVADLAFSDKEKSSEKAPASEYDGSVFLRSPVSLHAVAGVLSFCVLGGVALALLPQSKKPHTQIGEAPALLIVDHEAPLTLALTVTVAGQRMLLDIDHSADEELSLTLPEDWSRREVRWAKLIDFRSDPPAFGMRQHVLPPHAGASFVGRSRGGLVVKNTSSRPIEIRWTGVNLEEEHVVKDSFLLQQGELRVW